MYQLNKFENGLRLITVPMQHSNSVTVLILVGTGSKYEKKDVNGISHFLEHMFFKGTKKRPTALKIAETLDMVGGEYNAFTSKEITGFWAKVDKKHSDVALDWIADMFLESKFEENEIQKEKGVVIEELNMYLDTPTAYVSELWEKLLYGDQPAGWRIVGEKENITDFNRQKILDYYHSHYSSGNTIICVAGNINEGEIKSKIESLFQKIEKRSPGSKVKVIEQQNKPEVLVYEKKTDQTHLCLGVRTYDLFHPQRYAVSLLATILGGNMSSRLFTEVREKRGLAYYVHTSADASSDAGFLVTQAGVDNNNFEKAVEVIVKEYNKLKAEKLDEKELQKAKDYKKGTMSLSLDSSDSLASFFSMQELIEGKILSPEQKFELIDRVTVEDIQNVANDIFVPSKLNLAVIGPIEEVKKSKLEDLLKI